MGEREIDFVGERDGERLYVQVAYLLADRRTTAHETAPLLAVQDNYPKLLLTMDSAAGNDIDGIRRLYLPDWLAGQAA